jgi:hypothetical protein
VSASALHRLAALLTALFLGSHVRAAAEADPASDVLPTVRSGDSITLTVGGSFLNLSEVITMTPIDVKAVNERPGSANLVHLLISPLWIKEGDSQRPAFTTVRPYITPSHGRVRRFALMRENGEDVRNVEQMTPDCRYVLSLEFGHVIPKQFTVTVTMATPRGVPPETEFLYTPSNDGQPFRSGAPETFYTLMRVKAEPTLDPWHIVKDGAILPRADSSSVRLDRNVSHTIRFNVPEK